MVVEVRKLQPPEISLPPLNDLMAKEGKRPNWVHVKPNVFSYFYGAGREDGRVGFAIFVFFNTEVYVAQSDVAVRTKVSAAQVSDESRGTATNSSSNGDPLMT